MATFRAIGHVIAAGTGYRWDAAFMGEASNRFARGAYSHVLFSHLSPLHIPLLCLTLYADMQACSSWNPLRPSSKPLDSILTNMLTTSERRVEDSIHTSRRPSLHPSTICPFRGYL